MARPLATPLLAIGLLALAPIAAGQLPDPADHTCPDAETLDVDGFLVCLAWQVEDVENAPGNPTALLSGGCWPQSWRTVYDPGEDKWTPLFGTNSPLYGKAEVVVEAGQTLDMSIGFSWKGMGAKLKNSQTVATGSGLVSSDGASVVKYQYIEWKPYEKQYCGWDLNWHKWEEGIRPTNYRPNGVVDWDMGNLESSDLSTDADNSLRPSQSWSTPENTIALDLRYVTPDINGCWKPEAYEWFGEESVYSVTASMTLGGVLEAGATKSKTSANHLKYTFTSESCYFIDPLGSETFQSGWAFEFDEDGHTPADENECSGKSLLESPGPCAEEPCAGGLPLTSTAEAVICEVLPTCGDLEEVPIACGGLPPECGDGGEPSESCTPGIPGVPPCPPPTMALPLESCEPCDAVETALVACAVPRPSCEEAGLSSCPPVQRPCSGYAPGLAGEVARWVCEADSPDPCEVEGLNQLEAVFHCGDDGAED